MVFDITKVHDDVDAFFNPSGNAKMMLTPGAAKRVCGEATKLGFLVLCVEGGIFKDGMFEARLDCIWDGSEAAVDSESMKNNNDTATLFIEHASASHNAFIITVSRRHR